MSGEIHFSVYGLLGHDVSRTLKKFTFANLEAKVNGNCNIGELRFDSSDGAIHSINSHDFWTGLNNKRPNLCENAATRSAVLALLEGQFGATAELQEVFAEIKERLVGKANVHKPISRDEVRVMINLLKHEAGDDLTDGKILSREKVRMHLDISEGLKTGGRAVRTAWAAAKGDKIKTYIKGWGRSSVLNEVSANVRKSLENEKTIDDPTVALKGHFFKERRVSDGDQTKINKIFTDVQNAPQLVNDKQKIEAVKKSFLDSLDKKLEAGDYITNKMVDDFALKVTKGLDPIVYEIACHKNDDPPSSSTKFLKEQINGLSLSRHGSRLFRISKLGDDEKLDAEIEKNKGKIKTLEDEIKGLRKTIEEPEEEGKSSNLKEFKELDLKLSRPELHEEEKKLGDEIRKAEKKLTSMEEELEKLKRLREENWGQRQIDDDKKIKLLEAKNDSKNNDEIKKLKARLYAYNRNLNVEIESLESRIKEERIVADEKANPLKAKLRKLQIDIETDVKRHRELREKIKKTERQIAQKEVEIFKLSAVFSEDLREAANFFMSDLKDLSDQEKVETGLKKFINKSKLPEKEWTAQLVKEREELRVLKRQLKNAEDENAAGLLRQQIAAKEKSIRKHSEKMTYSLVLTEEAERLEGRISALGKGFAAAKSRLSNEDLRKCWKVLPGENLNGGVMTNQQIVERATSIKKRLKTAYPEGAVPEKFKPILKLANSILAVSSRLERTRTCIAKGGNDDMQVQTNRQAMRQQLKQWFSTVVHAKAKAALDKVFEGCETQEDLNNVLHRPGITSFLSSFVGDGLDAFVSGMMDGAPRKYDVNMFGRFNFNRVVENLAEGVEEWSDIVMSMSEADRDAILGKDSLGVLPLAEYLRIRAADVGPTLDDVADAEEILPLVDPFDGKALVGKELNVLGHGGGAYHQFGMKEDMPLQAIIRVLAGNQSNANAYLVHWMKRKVPDFAKFKLKQLVHAHHQLKPLKESAYIQIIGYVGGGKYQFCESPAGYNPAVALENAQRTLESFDGNVDLNIMHEEPRGNVPVVAPRNAKKSKKSALQAELDSNVTELKVLAMQKQLERMIGFFVRNTKVSVEELLLSPGENEPDSKWGDLGFGPEKEPEKEPEKKHVGVRILEENNLREI